MQITLILLTNMDYSGMGDSIMVLNTPGKNTLPVTVVAKKKVNTKRTKCANNIYTGLCNGTILTSTGMWNVP